jgi:tRNA:m4X modification enzyme
VICMYIGMDIRHCWVAQLPAVADSHESVIVAKHLCGVATDLALRSLAGFKTTSAQSLLGVSIATCCHHACIWKDYCGADWLLERGFTSQDFEVMKHWSGK